MAPPSHSPRASSTSRWSRSASAPTPTASASLTATGLAEHQRQARLAGEPDQRLGDRKQLPLHQHDGDDRLRLHRHRRVGQGRASTSSDLTFQANDLTVSFATAPTAATTRSTARSRSRPSPLPAAATRIAFALNMSATFGTVAWPGPGDPERDSHGSSTWGSTANSSSAASQVEANNLAVSYLDTADGNTFALTGGVGFSLDGAQFTAQLIGGDGNPGIEINDGVVQFDGVKLQMTNLDLGEFAIKDAYLQFSIGHRSKEQRPRLHAGRRGLGLAPEELVRHRGVRVQLRKRRVPHPGDRDRASRARSRSATPTSS